MPNAKPSARGLRSGRTRVVIGVVGLAAALGGAAYVISDRAPQPDITAGGAVMPVASADAVDRSPDSAAAIEPPSRDSASPTATVSLSKTDAERIAAAKKYAESHGAKVFHPKLPRTGAGLSAAGASATQRTVGSLKEDGSTMRIVTARGDLTGQRELAWVAGGVSKVGDISCSQTFQWANAATPEKKQNMLVCWRTSAEKSVATVAVDLKGHPSKEKSAATIRAEWRKLG